MVYALAVTIAAGVVVLLLLSGGYLLARRTVESGGLAVPNVRWRPSPLGLMVLLPVAAFLLRRIFPVFFFLPIILRLLVRGRGMPWSNDRPGDRDDGAIEGEYRPLDDE